MSFMSIKLKEYLDISVNARQKIIDRYNKKLSQDFLPGTLLEESSILPTYSHRKTGLNFKLIFGGDYQIGLSEEEENAARKICDPIPANLDEMRPMRIVEVNTFLISALPILNEFTSKHSELTLEQSELPSFPSFLTKENADKLASKFDLRLPDEKEWEYACRGTTQSLFAFGNEIPNDEELEKWLSWDFSNPTFLNANSFGLYGIYIGEWCRDRYRVSHHEDASCLDADSFVIKGGGALFWPWQDEEWVWCVSAMRMPSKNLLDGTCGFRFVYEIHE